MTGTPAALKALSSRVATVIHGRLRWRRYSRPAWEALAYLSGSNGIEGEDSALEQRKHPLERGSELPRDRVKLRV